MPNLHIVVGDANTRKSSLLRCLTGVGSGNATRYIQVAEASGNVLTVFCMLSALQESYKPMTPAAFVRFVRQLSPQATDVAVTLRANARGTYPGLAAYLQAFSQAGWPVRNAAFLGPGAYALRTSVAGANSVAVTRSPNQPTNQTAQQVRKAWGWA